MTLLIGMLSSSGSRKASDVNVVGMERHLNCTCKSREHKGARSLHEMGLRA